MFFLLSYYILLLFFFPPLLPDFRRGSARLQADFCFLKNWVECESWQRFISLKTITDGSLLCLWKRSIVTPPRILIDYKLSPKKPRPGRRCTCSGRSRRTAGPTRRPSAPGMASLRPRTGRRHDGRSAKSRQNVARFRLYRHRSLQANTRFAAFFKIYQII